MDKAASTPRREPRAIVGYCRVSTQLQGHDGLGMAAQRRAVAAFAAGVGSEVIAVYAEVETGRKADLRNRPQLVSAIGHARRAHALLVIARIDRLARNVFVTSQLLESGVDFVACDNPHANRMSIQILAVMAEHESRMISERVKATNAVRRARGDVFRCYRKLTPEQRRMGQLAAAAANRRRTKEAYADLIPIVRRLRESGESLRAIASRLDELGHRTQTGGRWKSATVHHLLRREGLGHLKCRPRIRPPIPHEVQSVGTAMAGMLRSERARQAYAKVMPLITELHQSGLAQRNIAQLLNDRGFTTQHHRPWTDGCVRALMRREKLLPPAVHTGKQGGFSTSIRELGVAAAAAKKRAETDRWLAKVMPLVDHLRALGLEPAQIAESLNRSRLRRRTGTPWAAANVRIAIAQWERAKKEKR